jgi:probable rRNA maturation factor
MIEINNLTRQKINKKFLTRVAKNILKRENRVLDISIVFVGEKRIKELNKKYRKKDKPTDVLSFGNGLNEIVICLKIVEKSAKKNNAPFKKELAEVLTHGILHLLGYEHGDIMKDKQKKALTVFNL